MVTGSHVGGNETICIKLLSNMRRFVSFSLQLARLLVWSERSEPFCLCDSQPNHFPPLDTALLSGLYKLSLLHLNSFTFSLIKTCRPCWEWGGVTWHHDGGETTTAGAAVNKKLLSATEIFDFKNRHLNFWRLISSGAICETLFTISVWKFQPSALHDPVETSCLAWRSSVCSLSLR